MIFYLDMAYGDMQTNQFLTCSESYRQINLSKLKQDDK